MANTTEKTNKKKSSGTKLKAKNTKKTVEEPKPVTPVYEKCGVYWCRFFGGTCCTFPEGETMKKIVCIKEEGEKFFKTPRPRSRFAID